MSESPDDAVGVACGMAADDDYPTRRDGSVCGAY